MSDQLQRPGQFTPRQEPPVPIGQEAGWDSAGLDAMAKKKNRIIAPAGNWIPVVQPVA
jgi:hypothetical protein